MTYQFSHHAQMRAGSRGISLAVIKSIIDHFDVDYGVGSGCRVLRLSRSAACEAAIGLGDKSLMADLAAVSLIENEVTGRIVTALRIQSGSRGRRYRRAH